MQVKQFGGGESLTKTINLELLKFTGERLPQYEWLRKIYPPEKAPTTGGGRHGEPD